jgi:hypothetical protein
MNPGFQKMSLLELRAYDYSIIHTQNMFNQLPDNIKQWLRQRMGNAQQPGGVNTQNNNFASNQPNQANSGGLFGQNQNNSALGNSSGGLFGNQTNNGINGANANRGGFNALGNNNNNQANSGGLFNSTNKQQGGGFMNNNNGGGGLFGAGNNNAGGGGLLSNNNQSGSGLFGNQGNGGLSSNSNGNMFGNNANQSNSTRLS